MKSLRCCFAEFLVWIAVAGATPAHAVVNVLACEPEWASLVREIATLGGDVSGFVSPPVLARVREHASSRR